MTALVQVLEHAGFAAKKPRGSFFLYVKAPRAVVTREGKRIEFRGAEDVSQWLIAEKLISTVPWDDAGAYLRWSVTFAARGPAEEGRIVTEVARRLSDARFEF
jgi:LL-diaminopimelate aminotransferase